jgi:hypothetical protein
MAATATVLETMWTVYYVIEKKSQNFTLRGIEVTPDFWIDAFSGKDKLTGSLQKLGILDEFSNLKSDVITVNRKLGNAKTFFVTDDWHGALKSQNENFLKNPKVSFTKKLEICRQDYFYKISNIGIFLNKVYMGTFKINVKSDRWNPADVWFFDQSAVDKIKEYIKLSVVMGNAFQNMPNDVQKKYAIDDIVGLNGLIYKLYEQKKLAPISLKKATSTKGVYSSRIGLVNFPSKEIPLPNPPSVKSRTNSIKNESTYYEVNETLKYVVEVDQLTLEKNGKMSYKRETDTIRYNNASSSLKVEKEAQFKTAAGGSMGMGGANIILYNSGAIRKMQSIRGQVFNKSLSPDIVSNGEMIGKSYDDKKKNSEKYMDVLAKNIDPSVKNKTLSSYIGNYRNAQNKLEIVFAIQNSGNQKKQDEIILDLWSGIVSKGILNRKDSEKIIERIGKNIYNKSKKIGQKNLTQDQADDKARSILMANQIAPNKISASFHLKLY